ncbi:MAG: hypothetical protein B7Z55_10655 [Planctomycetales bacterium 12-60-4]|nr:MAG: hypothetical protein B7Z55_10655 [Planctomycetales bacterium 12-60-4]
MTQSPGSPIQDAQISELCLQGRKNLRLVSKPNHLQTCRRTVLILGELIDRPGLSDRGVTSPAVGMVTQMSQSDRIVVTVIASTGFCFLQSLDLNWLSVANPVFRGLAHQLRDVRSV